MPRRSKNSGIGRKLKHIDLEVTRECNLKCSHCSASSKKRGLELSEDKIKGILQQAQTLGLEKVGLTGGEPFLVRQKLKSIGEFAVNDLKIPIHIHSNGTMITQQDAEWIRSENAEITIPLYGYSARIHEKITGIKGSFIAACEGLDYLIDAKANVCVYIVPMRQNLSSIHPLVEFIYKKGVKKLRVLSLSPTGRAKTRFTEIELYPHEKAKLNSELVKIHKEYPIDLRVGFCTSQNYKGLKLLDEHETCSAAEHRIHIDTFGNVFPCTASSGRAVFSAGNLQVDENNLSVIWKFAPLLQFFRDFHVNPPSKCTLCLRHVTCMSGCRVRMAFDYHDVTIADPACKGPHQSKS